MKRARPATLCLLIVWGCSELPQITPNVCGNKVLERSEACDTFSVHGEGTLCGPPESSHPCRYVCEDARCPAGWACGADLLCRSPTGTFIERPQVVPFRSTLVEVGDVDGDERADLLGFDRSRINARFNTGERSFEGEYVLDTRLPLTRPFMGHVDEDERLDVILTTALGPMILLGQSDQTLLSRLYESGFGTGSEAETHIFSIADRTRVAQIEDIILTVPGGIIVAVSANEPTEAPPAWYDPTTVTDAVASTELLPGERPTFALWGGDQIGLFMVEGNDVQSFRVRLQLTLQAPARVRRVFFADVDGDAAMDVLALTEQAGAPVSVAFANTSSVGPPFDPFCPILHQIVDPDGAFSVTNPLLEVGDFDEDGILDYVYDALVMVSAEGPPPQCNIPSQTFQIGTTSVFDPFVDAERGDFNGDGRLDFVSVGAERQIQFHIGSGTGGFAVRTVQVDQRPKKLTVGDYDGDFIDDAAFALPVSRGMEGDLLAVAFGSADSVISEPSRIGRFGNVSDMSAIQWAPDLLQNPDLVTDLLLFARAFEVEAATSFAIAYGSTSRQMFAPFTFADTDSPQVALMAKVCDGPPDLVAIQHRGAGTDAQLLFGRGIAGEPPGRIDPQGLMGMVPTELSRGVNFDCILFSAADVDRDGHDELIGITRSTDCPYMDVAPSELLIIDAADGDADCPSLPTFERMPIADGSFTTAVTIRTPDLDRDGWPEIVVTFAGVERAGSGALVAWPSAERVLDRVTVLSPAPEETSLDTTAVQLDTDPELELVSRSAAGERARVYRRDAEDDYATAELLFALPINPGLIVGDDLDGDGLDDLVLTDGTRAHLFWAVSP